MHLYRELTTCRACGSTDLRPAFALGTFAINAFPKHDDSLDFAPLNLMICHVCELVQLSHAVRRDRLYREYYYRSNTNETMIKALNDVVASAVESVKLEDGDHVLDIGSNDGTLLLMYPPGVKCIGFEPSNVGRSASYGRIFSTYFPDISVKPPPEGCKVITAIAMFYDVEHPREFLHEVRHWLHKDGVFIVQMPDLAQMLHENAFDNVCHEHLCYWPTHTFVRAARIEGLHLARMEHNDVNGGSIRYYFERGDPTPEEHGQSSNFQIYDKEIWYFNDRVIRLKAATVELIKHLKDKGASIWAYGASTKGNTLLQYYGLNSKLITAVADRNPEKWGRKMVTGIPITSEEAFRVANPDFALVLPWAFIDNFRTREREWLRHGKFIVPLPELKIVGGTDAALYPEISTSTTR